MSIKKNSIRVAQTIDELSVEQLRNTLECYQRIFSGSGYGFWEWDLETNRIDWLGSFWQQLGYTNFEQEGFYDADRLPDYVHPDDRDVMFVAVREHLRTARPLHACYRIRSQAGHYIWAQVRADSIRDDQGRARYISGINFDVTELKAIEAALRESEERQQRIIQASKDGIWEWHAETDEYHFSSRCWEQLGYDDGDDLQRLGEDRLQQWRKHIHPEDLPKFDSTLRQHMSGCGAFDIEYRVYTRQGEVRWIRARGRASFDNAGKPARMSGTNMDVTDIKRAEERVMQAKEAAEQANRAKSAFLSSMSHELRTPLNAILGYTQLFAYDDNLRSAQKENLQEIRAAGEHLLGLINDVLDLAQVESGNMNARLQPVLVARLLNDCFTFVQPQADARGIYLQANTNNLDHACVTADPVRLKQALVNLLGNAIKYNRVGGRVQVTLSLETERYLRISVQDTGIGIAKHRHSEVFQPFNRLQVDNDKIEGSGVGLVITKQLVEMMHGKIGFTSAEGEGACFWLDLIRCGAAVDERPPGLPEQALTAEEDDTLWDWPGARVLYIEDNPTNIRLMQQFFARYPSFYLEVSSEPYGGIFYARSHTPDVIVLDINLPGLDGFEVLKVLQADPTTASIPVIGLSANVLSLDVQKAQEAGFFAYLTKPLNISQLVQALNKLSASKRG
jgi:PAS domain S-box-containing protein